MSSATWTRMSSALESGKRSVRHWLRAHRGRDMLLRVGARAVLEHTEHTAGSGVRCEIDKK